MVDQPTSVKASSALCPRPCESPLRAHLEPDRDPRPRERAEAAGPISDIITSEHILDGIAI